MSSGECEHISRSPIYWIRSLINSTLGFCIILDLFSMWCHYEGGWEQWSINVYYRRIVYSIQDIWSISHADIVVLMSILHVAICVVIVTQDARRDYINHDRYDIYHFYSIDRLWSLIIDYRSLITRNFLSF